MYRPMYGAAILLTVGIALVLLWGIELPLSSFSEAERIIQDAVEQEEQSLYASARDAASVQITGVVTGRQKKETTYGTVIWELTLDKKILCSFDEEEDPPRLGQKVILTGELRSGGSGSGGSRSEGSRSGQEASNPGQFDFERWYMAKGIRLRLTDCRVISAEGEADPLLEKMESLRQWATVTLKECLGETDGSLIAAMVLGDKSGIPDETKALYQQNGISHILSISGLHLMLLGMGLVNVLKKTPLPVWLSTMISAGTMILYCIFVGGSVSALRATVMFCVQLSAGVLGRSYDSLSALGLAAIIQLILNPYVLWDSGFQLSYLAVVGVSAVTPRLKTLFQTENKLMESVLVSAGVALATLPILLYQYGTYAWHSIFLNLLVVPVMAVLLWLALLLLLLCGLFSAGFLLCQWIGALIGGILYYYELVCKATAALPIWETYIGRPLVVMVVIYTVGMGILLFGRHRQSGGVCILGILVCIRMLTFQPTGGMEITMLDVGQGDGMVIRSESGRVYLSDCGSSSVKEVGTYRLLPFLRAKGYGRIEGIFVSHLDSDHYSGIMELLEAAKVEHLKLKTIYLPVSVRGEEAGEKAEGKAKVKAEEEAEGKTEYGGKDKFSELLELAEQAGVKVEYLEAGDRLVDGRMEITCLHPSGEQTYESNNGSLVMAVEWEDFSMLLTGDVEEDGEKEILRRMEAMGEVLEVGKVGKVGIGAGREEFEGVGVGRSNRIWVDTFDVLKVAHHGSSGSSSEEFLSAVNPVISLISCGENNSYGHPHKETLKRLEMAGSQILTTAEYGAITIEVGRSIKVYGFKE